MRNVGRSKGWAVVLAAGMVAAACSSKGGGRGAWGGAGGGGTAGVAGSSGDTGAVATTTGACGSTDSTGGADAGDGSLVVTLLGTGSPIPAPDRFGNSTLIEAAGLRLVFDIGRGAPIRLWQKQIPLGTINAHFLTHLHSDHVNGLPDLWLSGWIQTPFGSRKTPFVIFGPAGTEALMAHLWDAYAEDRRIRLADEMNPIEGIEYEAHDVDPGAVYC